MKLREPVSKWLFTGHPSFGYITNKTQKKTNESLAKTIDELASLTKIQEVAEQQGLSYNNSNIKTIIDDKEDN